VFLSSGGHPHTSLDEVEHLVMVESSSDSDDEEWESNRITPENITASSVQSIRRPRAVFERWKHEARHESQAVRSPQTTAVVQLRKPQST
jgi:hypothetical protein